MKKLFQSLIFFATVGLFAQAGHVMQGVGAINMSMGGAATGQPLDISGAIQWNPAALSKFDENMIKLDVGAFFSSPELSSTVPLFDETTGMPNGQFFSGTTEDDRGVSPMPAIAAVWGKSDSKMTWGVSAFGISGFGVTFPENMMNPINNPQPDGFGRIESDYGIFQFGLSWAYDLGGGLSVAVQPNFNYATLELQPNPSADPSMTAGYPTSDKASTTGFGAQVALFYDTGNGFSFGLSYKSKQNFKEFEFDNTFLDGSTGNSTLDLDYPAIYSAGIGYTVGDWDLAFDFRLVDYENTAGFDESGWNIDAATGFPTGSVKGFGWKNINILSTGVQYRGVDKLPLRVGYTYSSNPIDDDLAFFNIPATAIIAHAFQFGLSYEVSDRIQIDGVYHYGTSDGATAGPMYNPMLIQDYPPYGTFPGSEVSYEMTTSMVMVGVSYSLGGSNNETD